MSVPGPATWQRSNTLRPAPLPACIPKWCRSSSCVGLSVINFASCFLHCRQNSSGHRGCFEPEIACCSRTRTRSLVGRPSFRKGSVVWCRQIRSAKTTPGPLRRQNMFKLHGAAYHELSVKQQQRYKLAAANLRSSRDRQLQESMEDISEAIKVASAQAAGSSSQAHASTTMMFSASPLTPSDLERLRELYEEQSRNKAAAQKAVDGSPAVPCASGAPDCMLLPVCTSWKCPPCKAYALSPGSWSPTETSSQAASSLLTTPLSRCSTMFASW